MQLIGDPARFFCSNETLVRPHVSVKVQLIERFADVETEGMSCVKLARFSNVKGVQEDH